MPSFVILSKLAPDALKQPGDLRKLADSVSARIKQECPGVHWKDSFATLGQFDVVDIVEADSPVEAERAAMIIRSVGHADTETMFATPWRQFLDEL